MKYMGSKSFMLQNGLGDRIKVGAKKARRVVDLFSGAAHISWFAAQNTKKPILAVDLQGYSKILAESVLLREHEIDPDRLVASWIEKAEGAVKKSKYYETAVKMDDWEITNGNVGKLRKLCREKRGGVIWGAYGGHYFSPLQAMKLDVMRKYLPRRNPDRSVCLAATIIAASKCAASPGHTAQPFQPTKGAAKFLQQAWRRDPISLAEQAVREIAQYKSEKLGKAVVADALNYTRYLRKTDLVIVDPPYSGVQYSRFYHVLETIATGECGPVDGVGRYPSKEKRPQSSFSNKGESKEALKKLLLGIAKKEAKVIFTFPAGKASNGLSGRYIVQTASRWFRVSKAGVFRRSSTLGANADFLKARRKRKELILWLTPPKGVTERSK